MTKGPSKQARQGGRTAQQLLADYTLGDDAAGKLWLEYYWAFKGKKHVVGFQHLRADLGLDDELTDDELAEDVRELAILLLRLLREQWRVVVGNDARAELMDVAGCGDAAKVWEWLAGLDIKPSARQRAYQPAPLARVSSAPQPAPMVRIHVELGTVRSGPVITVTELESVPDG